MSPPRASAPTVLTSTGRPAQIVVIGGGLGGLAAAIRLQAAGHNVTLVEAREQLGGRAYQLREAGFTFDMGPTIVTAPVLLEALWASAGRQLAEDVTLVPLKPFYRLLFPDGSHFDYGSSQEADEAEIARFDPRDVAGYHAFLAATARIEQRAFEELGHSPFLSAAGFLRVVPELIRLGATRSVYRFTADYFHDPRLRAVFSFHPLFIGGNPFRASAIYSIVPYLERRFGVYFVMGGMYQLITAMGQLLVELGGTVHCNSPVAEILVRHDRAAGVRLADGAEIPADAVVANSDVATTYSALVPPSHRKRRTLWRLARYRYSMSCFLLYLGLTCTYPQLHHHTVLMPRDYRAHIAEIFDGRGLPNDLALYLHTPTRTDPRMAPPGGESLYALVPVPHLERGIDWARDGDQLRDRVIRTLEEEVGLDGLSGNIAVERRFTPFDFATTLRSRLGSAFSIEPTLLQSAYFRPHNRSADLPGLYFVGAGTHPGAGLPGVLLSAEITSHLVNDDLTSQPPTHLRQPTTAGRPRGISAQP